MESIGICSIEKSFLQSCFEIILEGFLWVQQRNWKDGDRNDQFACKVGGGWGIQRNGGGDPSKIVWIPFPPPTPLIKGGVGLSENWVTWWGGTKVFARKEYKPVKGGDGGGVDLEMGGFATF